MAVADNKRVAKNAVALTLRMVLVTAVGLFTSRIVLQALGVDDYGIYGVIGGVVGMASFLNTAMAGATSRFITFELGTGDESKLSRIFSTALIIHFAIAVIVAVLAETIGLWFVNQRMNFPPDRMFAVNILYQFTIISMIVSFTQVPYTSEIIAHEKMNIYAYFEIINVVLKLIIVYVLLVVNTDKLILYGALTFGVSLFTALIYRVYCLKNFRETKFKFVNDKAIRHQMLAFSGYDLYGNMCAAFRVQGIPIILNLFFGVVANAGASIAATVTGILCGFTGSVTQAFKPQIIKLYSADEISRMLQMMTRSMKFGLLVFGMVAIPVMLETKTLLMLWLGTIPPYAEDFIRLVLISLYFNVIVMINNTGIHATGDIRNISLINGTLCLLSPIISWMILKYGVANANVVYIVDFSIFFLIMILGWYFLKKQIPSIAIKRYIWHAFSSMAVACVTFLSVYEVQVVLPNLISQNIGVLSLILCSLLSAIILSVLTYTIVFDDSERRAIMTTLKNKILVFY